MVTIEVRTKALRAGRVNPETGAWEAGGQTVMTLHLEEPMALDELRRRLEHTPDGEEEWVVEVAK